MSSSVVGYLDRGGAVIGSLCVRLVLEQISKDGEGGKLKGGWWSSCPVVFSYNYMGAKIVQASCSCFEIRVEG